MLIDELLTYDMSAAWQKLEANKEHALVVASMMTGATREKIDAIRDSCDCYEGFVQGALEQEGVGAARTLERLWLATTQGTLWDALRAEVSSPDHLDTVATFLAWLHIDMGGYSHLIRRMYEV